MPVRRSSVRLIRPCRRTTGVALRGSHWLQLHAALATDAPLTTLLRCCAEFAPELRSALQTQLRNLLHYHCGVSSLRTRQVMMELQAL